MKFKKIILSLLLTGCCSYVFSSDNNSDNPQNAENMSGKVEFSMTLEDVILTAYDQSLSALIAKYNFLASYWSYRSFKAKLLPSLNLSAGLAQYNRSLVTWQGADGSISYIQNDNMRNSLTLSLDQNIAATGGTISVYSHLNRLDEFSPSKNLTYNSQPINVSYSQPIFSYNSFKWDKIIEPKKFEQAKRSYLETMESIAINASQYFFNVLLKQEQYRMAIKNYENSKLSYNIALERFKIGSVQQDELLQLELNMLNDEMSINQYKLDADMAMLSLNSYLGFNEKVHIELIVPDNIPDVSIDYAGALEMSYENSNFTLDNELDILAAQQSVARAKGTGSLQVALNAQFGLTQQGGDIGSAYSGLRDQEIVGLSLSVPVVDWGMKKGQVKMAMSREEMTRTMIEQSILDHEQQVFIKVVQFNNQRRQCEISKKADDVASRSFNVAFDRFKNGTISVFDLNTAQTKKDNATVKYITELQNYWNYYLNIRKMTLYDYMKDINLSAEFDKLVE